MGEEDRYVLQTYIEQGNRGAIAAFLYDRFADDVDRMVWHVMGRDAEHQDVVNEVFLRMCDGIAKLRDLDKLPGWAMSVAVNTARSEIRRRQTVRKYAKPEMLPFSGRSEAVDYEAREQVEQTYEILSKMSETLRTVFALRYIDQKQLAEVAALCGWSTATAKRRLRRAEKRFADLAKHYPAIYQRLLRGGRMPGVK